MSRFDGSSGSSSSLLSGQLDEVELRLEIGETEIFGVFLACPLLGLAGAQLIIEFLHWMNIIEEYPIKIGPGGISEEMASFSRLMWGLAFAGIVPYLAASYFVAGRMRAWIDKAGYSAAARALARMRARARAPATARCVAHPSDSLA